MGSFFFGQVFAILASLESLVPIGMSQAYASLWKATSGLGEYLVGSCYFLSAALTVIATGLAIVGAVLLRGRDLGDGDPNEKVFRPTYRLTEQSFLTRWYAPPMLGVDRRDGGGDDHADGGDHHDGGDQSAGDGHTDSLEQEMNERKVTSETDSDTEVANNETDKEEDKY